MHDIIGLISESADNALNVNIGPIWLGLSFCLKQVKISASGVRKIILIQRLNKIIILTPLADISACFKQIYFFLENKNNLTCTVNASWFKNV